MNSKVALFYITHALVWLFYFRVTKKTWDNTQNREIPDVIEEAERVKIRVSLWINL